MYLLPCNQYSLCNLRDGPPAKSIQLFLSEVCCIRIRPHTLPGYMSRRAALRGSCAIIHCLGRPEVADA